MDHMAGIMDACNAYEILNSENHEAQINNGEDAKITSGEFGATACNIRFIKEQTKIFL